MALNQTDDIVLKLAVKGVEPGEAARLASSSVGQLEAEMRASLARQVEAHRHSLEQTTQLGQQYSKQEIAYHQQKTKEVQAAYQLQTRAAAQADAEIQRMGKAQAAAILENMAREKAAVNEADEAYRHHIETLRAVTETAAIWYEATKVGYEKLKQFSEEVIRTSKVFASLRGENGAEIQQQGIIGQIFGGPKELQDARDATEGVVSDMDLIIAKNRAAQLDLDLSGPRFAKVAKAAEEFASAVGIDTGEALNQLSTGLATGNAKLLKHAGILVDAQTAYQKWGDAHGGVTADVMTADQKLQAFQEEAFTKIDKKLEESGSKAQTFGKTLEQAFTEVKNVWDRTLAVIGNAKMFDALADQDVLSEVSGDNSPLEQQKRSRNKAILAARAEREKAITDAREARMAAEGKDAGLAAFGGELPTDNTFSGDVDAFGNQIQSLTGKEIAGSHAAKGHQGKVQTSAMQRLFSGFKHSPEMDQEAEDAATDIHDAMQKAIADVFASNGLFTPEEQAKILSKPWEKLPDKTMGVDFLRKQGWDIPEENGNSDADAKFEAEQKKRIEAADKLLRENKKRNEKTGGWLSFTLGEDFLEKSQSEMTELEQATLSFTANMSESLKSIGDAAASAIGHGLAAAIGENKNLKSILKDTTHSMLMAISQQAFVKAAWNAAEGIGALVSAPAAAPGFFAAAAAFTGVAALAGFGAAATNSSPSSSGGSAAGATPTSYRSPVAGYGAGGPVNGGVGTGQGGPVSITIHVNPGGETETGRSLLKALEALKAQTGIDIAKRLSA